MFGFCVCLTRALWVWLQPGFIPDIIRRMPLIVVRNRPNRPLTIALFMLGAFICLIAIGVRVQLNH